MASKIETINLIGRGSKPTSALRHISDNLYRYVLLNDLPYTISRDGSSYAFIDPADGPLLGVGSVVEGRIVLSIYADDKGFLVELSDKNTNKITNA